VGQQQLLLIVVGIIIVSLAIWGGLVLFRANAIDQKRNAVTNELVNLAAMAQQYYMKPTSMGGGGRNFTGWTIPSELVLTGNGHYKAQIAPDNVVLNGIGNEVVTNNDSVQVNITVLPATYNVTIIY
jgi:hypothetical protein